MLTSSPGRSTACPLTTGSWFAGVGGWDTLVRVAKLDDNTWDNCDNNIILVCRGGGRGHTCLSSKAGLKFIKNLLWKTQTPDVETHHMNVPRYLYILYHMYMYPVSYVPVPVPVSYMHLYGLYPAKLLGLLTVGIQDTVAAKSSFSPQHQKKHRELGQSHRAQLSSHFFLQKGITSIN